MSISLLVAATENNVIGKDNKLLWHLPNDLRYFKNLTYGGVMLMGRKTFESIGKPLPGRVNIVISANPSFNAKGIIKAASIEEGLARAQETNCREIFVIGGGDIYRQMMNMADKIYMTRVHTVMDGHAYFPEINEAQWQKTSAAGFKADEKHAFDYTFETWEKLANRHVHR